MTHMTFLSNNFEPGASTPRPAVLVSEQVSQRVFLGAAALLFALSAAMTIVWCDSMSAMAGMPMPGGWTMSMAWMRMPGQTWAGAAATFVGMWVVMMMAMMLPSLAPVLWRYYRRCIGTTNGPCRGQLATLAGLGYFFAWTLFGLAIFPVGVAAVAMEMKQPMLSRAVPVAAALVVLIAGVLQFTSWKAHHLTRCRDAPGHDCVPPTHVGGACRLGFHLGLQCGLSCANLTAILLVVGVMDLRAMVFVTAAISAERLAPAGKRVARGIGVVIVGTALFVMVRAVRLG